MQISVYGMTPYYSGGQLADKEAELMSKIDEIVAEGGVSQFNLASHVEKLEYLGPQLKSARYRDSHERMMSYIKSRIPYVSTTGVQLLKYHGLGKRDGISIRAEDSYEVPECSNISIATDDGHATFSSPFIEEFYRHLNSVMKMMIWIERASKSGRGSLYVKWPNNSVMQKGQIEADGIPRQYVFVNFNGLQPHHFEYYGEPGDVIHINSFIVNAQLPNELNSDGKFIGNDSCGFFNCRRPEYNDWQSLWNSLYLSAISSNTVQVFDWEEDNSPWPHTHSSRTAWIARLTELAANITYRVTGNRPVFFRTDPRKSNMEHIYHRTCVRGSAADYISAVPIDTPMVLLNWFEGADPEFVAAEEYRTRSRERMFGWYAGTQNIQSVVDGLKFNKLIPQEQRFVVCYNDVHWKNVISDIQELKRVLS